MPRRYFRTPSSGLSRVSRRAAPLIAVLMLGAVLPSLASASVTGLLQDCATDGRLDGTYNAADYAGALAHMPTDMDEYTDCRHVIRNAQLGVARTPRNRSHDVAVGGGASGPSAAGPTESGSGVGVRAYDDALAAATPQERASVARLATAAPLAVELAGQRVSPDSRSGGLDTTNRLPASLIAVLALLGAGLLVTAVRAAGRAHAE